MQLNRETRQNRIVETRLLATDQQSSVLSVLTTTGPNPQAYTPYGHRHPDNGLLSLLGFNGELSEPMTGHHLLGNGYRAFNPVLMRFNSPDSWSPFGEGGLNAYAYCVGDPVNRVDPTGHIGNLFKGVQNIFGRTPRSARVHLTYEDAVAQNASTPTTIRPASPPPYSPETLTPNNRMFLREPNELPPPYSAQDILPPPYSSRENLASSGVRSSNTPDRDRTVLPPRYPFPEEAPRIRPGRNQTRINELRAHRQRIRDNTSHIPRDQLPDSITETLQSIREELAHLRGRR
ncbi:RHS repeat-associated core domain-containing protein [Pseudomonas sp. Irchel s3b2]|uniref:RHS repeat-associated core domain-containing protein n=1 Tax=Pseudomonas sp. Irchel s3b2 TaxID=2009073 RepID=UPI000BA343E5